MLQPLNLSEGYCISSPGFDDTIGDETLRQFEVNLSLSSSDDETVPSLATRIKKKTGLGVTRIKGRKSVSNPDQPLDLSFPEEENDENLSEKPPLPQKARFATVSEQELESLQFDAKAKRTHQQTKWGVKLFKGRLFFV